jgi:large subunit ribosomal protein L22
MEARAIQRTVRQSPRKMRLVVDQIRGRAVPEAYAILRFSKKRAAVQIHKVLKSAVANAEQAALRQNLPLDVDRLRVIHAVVNEGTTLKRFTSAAQGRATPVKKRTSHVEIRVAEGPAARVRPAPAKAPEAPAAAPRGQPPRGKGARAKGAADPGAAPRGAPKARSKPATKTGKKGSE